MLKTINNKSVTVFDVFSGAGGFSLGFEMAGCNALGAIEIDKWAAETYSYNHPNAKVLVGDIETFSNEFINLNSNGVSK